MAWPEDTAGGLMNPDAVSVQPEVTVDLVLRYLRTLGELPDNTNSIFVVDTKNRYQGTVLLSKLVTSNPQNQVKEILDKEAEAIDVSASEAEVAKVFTGLDMVTAAVVDDAGLLLGQITIDDVVDVIQELADHDILSRAGLDEDDDMFAPVVSSSRRRAVWLGANLATGFLAAAVVSVFQPTIEKVVILAVLMPVVASMGGIAGSQTLTLMIRGMALGRVQDSNQRWLLRKELSVAVLNGIIWAAVVAVVTMLFFASWKVGLIIAAALAINLLAAALAGFSIPLILRRLNIDPALAGGVVLTTFTDVIGFVAFLGLGALFLT
jgi:magnesium transporter